jgi:CheY-like chemotaxis protein
VTQSQFDGGLHSVESSQDADRAATAKLGTALVVEDETLIRMVTAEELADAGFEIVESATADEALEMLDDGLRPDLIVTDVMMPGGLDGIGLARLARKRYPTLPIIIVSGFSDYSSVDLTLGGTAVHLPKPYPDGVLKSLALACATGRQAPEPALKDSAG